MRNAEALLFTKLDKRIKDMEQRQNPAHYNAIHRPKRIKVRTADNVLTEAEWGSYLATFTVSRVGTPPAQRVAKVAEIKRGMYGAPDLFGKTVAEVAEWSEEDFTGQHPEGRHEVSIGGEWQSFVTVAEIEKELDR